MASRFQQGDTLESLDEWGLGGRKFGTWVTWFLLGGDLYTAYTFIAVPAAMFATGRGRRILRGALHDHPLPDHLHLHGAAVVGQPPARLRHHRRLRARTLRLAGALAGGRRHRVPRDDALHRAPARRHPGGPRRGRSRRRRQLAGQGRAAADRLRGARGLHLHLGAARPGGDRLRQGRADLPRDHRGGDLPAHQVRRLGRRSSAPPRTRWRPPTRPPASRPAPSSPATASCGPTPRWRSARRWRCSCTRTRSPRPSPPRAVRRSGATPRSCRRTPSCWACWRCSAGSRSRPAPSRSGSTASPTRSW